MSTVDTYTVVAGKPTIVKDPAATLDYTVDFTEWLDAMSDSIASHTVTVSGVVLENSVVNAKAVVMWISGGTVGTPASATTRVTTAGGRTDERTIYFKIKNR